jgi:hypothetical protein
MPKVERKGNAKGENESLKILICYEKGRKSCNMCGVENKLVVFALPVMSTMLSLWHLASHEFYDIVSSHTFA